MEKLNKIISHIKENKWVHYLIIIIIGTILSIPLYKMNIRDTHDGFLHLLRLIGTKNSLKIGEIPPTIVPYFCNNWGYAMNLFYNPLVTYIPLLLKIITPTYAIALKLFASLCIILSGITMYSFVNKVTNKRPLALFSAIIYLIVPYKLGDVYIRFAIGEFAAFVFLPILFIGVYNLFNQEGNKHYYIAIGAIGLLLTHTVTTFYTAIICFVYILFNIKKLKEKEIIKKLIINVIFILLVSALFTMPMLEAKFSAEYTIFDNELMVTNSEYVYENTLEISDLFIYNGNLLPQSYKKSAIYIIGVPIFTLMCLTIFVYKKIDKKYKDFYIISWIFGIVSLFMCTKYCPWFLFPNILCTLQYPWRMLTFFAFFISFALGVNLYILIKMLFNKNITRVVISSILIILIIIYTIPILLEFTSNDRTVDIEYESRILNNPKINYMSINREYMPKKALLLQRTYLKERNDETYILEGQASIINENKEDFKDIVELENIQKNTILEFPYLYYPGYKITLEDNTKLEAIETEHGFVGCKITQDIEKAKITVEYKGTAVTYVSYVISFVSFIIFVVYCYRENKNNN